MPKRSKSERIEPSGHRCEAYGCELPGDFRAPKSKNDLRSYQWFCEAHIAEFNKKWNYFEGMTENEIYDFQRDATFGHRPTWRMDQLGQHSTAKVEEAFARMFGEGSVKYKAEARPISAKAKDALATLDLEHPSDKAKIKAQYRDLVKKYHPDVNRGNARAEETFKKVTAAYHYLVEHYLDS
ncbi:MAG: hypothetical protein B7X02_02880 [Rhodospirillales bacterium 12-54-5]|nr:MAG: hypothetical protein B7X02_02880 [Rhodospirillales bacterium 12-54-5]